LFRSASIGLAIFLSRRAAAIIPCVLFHIACSILAAMHALCLSVRGLPFAEPPPIEARLPRVTLVAPTAVISLRPAMGIAGLCMPHPSS
jgi:hypothetical protein